MPQTSEPSARQEIRKALMSIAIRADKLNYDEFDLNQLSDLNIRLEPMDLDEASSNKPSYFAPYPDNQIGGLDENYQDLYDVLAERKKPSQYLRSDSWPVAGRLEDNITHCLYHIDNNFP